MSNSPYSQITRRRRIRRPETWRWSAELSPKTIPGVGAIALALLRDPAKWVHRRVESFELVDTKMVRRQITLDFTLPPNLPTPLVRDGEAMVLTPITMMQRHAAAAGRGESGIMGFDVSDASGNSLPLLTERDGGLLAAAALFQYARSLLHDPASRKELKGRLGAALLRIPFQTLTVNAPTLRELLNPRSSEWRASNISVRARRCLANDREFGHFLALVAGNSAAFVPIASPLGTRQVIKMSYDELRFATPARRGGRIARILDVTGFAPATASLGLSFAGGAEAQHYQLTLPPHLELTDVELAAWRPLDVLRELIFDEPLPQATYAQFVRGFDPRTHIYERGAKPVASGTLHVGIRVERTGVMTGFVVAAAIITAVLVGYWRVTGRAVNAGSSTSIAALLLAPGLVAAYLARPGEHAIVRRLLVFPRVVLALSGGLTLVAAAALQILGPQSSPTHIALSPDGFDLQPVHLVPPDRLVTTLGVLAALAVVLLILLAAGWVFPRPGKPSRDLIATGRPGAS